MPSQRIRHPSLEDALPPKRWRTYDLMASKHSALFASEQIGIKRYKTPEGFLFCEDVPIARIGEMIYGLSELPVISPAPGQPHILVVRDAEELFKLETLLSFQGKDITNDHPPDDLSARNWKSSGASVGHIMNPRRGEGENSDVILADFLIKDQAAIEAIEAGKVEVSCGYDAFYKQLAPGRGKQTDIVGNHVALVERGRCGPRCAIGDRQLEEEDEDMRTRDNAAAASANQSGDTPAQRIRRHFDDAADAAVKELGGAGQGVNVHVHLGADGKATPAATKDGATADADKPVTQGQLATVMDSLKTLTDSVKALVKKPKGKPSTRDASGEEDDGDADDKTPTEDDAEDGDDDDKDGKGKTQDSKALETAFKSTIAGVEVLVPGMSFPAFDSATPRTKTMDSLCRMRTKALDRFSITATGGEVLKTLNGGKTYDSLTTDCKGTAALFKQAVAAQTVNNNRQSVGDQAHRVPQGQGNSDGFNYAPRFQTMDDINKRNTEFWKSRQG